MGANSPTPPDYTGAALTQGQFGLANINQQTANNRPDIDAGDLGSITWDRPQQMGGSGGQGGGQPQQPEFGPQYWGAKQNQMSLGMASNVLHGQDLEDWKKSYEHTNPDYAAITSNMTNGAGQSPWKMHVNLSPAQQAALKQQQAIQAGRSGIAMDLLGQARTELTTPMNWGALPQVGNGMDARNRAEDAIYNRETSRLDPMWRQREESQRSDLINSGLDPSSEAYTKQMGDFGRQRNDAYQGAMDQSIMGGGQEMSRQFQQDSQARQQAIAEAFQKQGWSLNALNAALSGQQVSMPSFPGFNTAGAAAPPNIFGAAQAGGQFGMDSAKMQNDLWGSGLSGLGGAAGAMMAFSDSRLKTKIVRMRDMEVIPGVPLAIFEWRSRPGDRQMGVIAQDVERVAPHLVKMHANGYKMVDYSFGNR